jgi:hypothetical protein
MLPAVSVTSPPISAPRPPLPIATSPPLSPVGCDVVDPQSL